MERKLKALTKIRGVGTIFHYEGDQVLFAPEAGRAVALEPNQHYALTASGNVIPNAHKRPLFRGVSLTVLSDAVSNKYELRMIKKRLSSLPTLKRILDTTIKIKLDPEVS